MPTGKINIYNMAEMGVNTTKSAIHIADGEVTKAQNLQVDPAGELGGVRRRDGIAKLNSVALSGSVKGLVGVPLPTTFATTLYAGRVIGSGSYTSLGWNSSTDGFVTNSTISSGTPANPRGDDKIVDWSGASGATQVKLQGVVGAQLGTFFYYASDNYTVYPTAGHTAPPIRAFDGTADFELLKIPYNPNVGAGTNTKAVMGMTAGGGLLFISTLDTGTSQADFIGRVFSYDPSSGVLAQLGADFPTGYIPYCLTYYLGRLWVGASGNTPTVATAGRVYFIRPGIDLAFTLDHTAPTNITDITSLLTYQGKLYSATRAKSGTAALIEVRATDGTWSTADTGISTATGNCYLGMGILNGVLYASYFKPSTLSASVRKFDGTTWSTAVADGVAPNQPVVIFYLFNSILYGIGPSQAAGTAIGGGLKTSDGSTFTALSLTNVNAPALVGFTS